MKKYFLLLGVLLLGVFPLGPDSLVGQTKIGISGDVAWDRMELNVELSVNLSEVGVRLPTGRMYAEAMLKNGYQYMVRPYLLAMPLDSSTSLEDLVNSGEFSLRRTDLISRAAKQSSSTLSLDLSTLSIRYTVDISQFCTALVQHNHPAPIMRTLFPVPTVAYTGVIIIADETLPIHGRHTSALTLPCFFPKIWDTDMNLIYDWTMLDQNTSVMVRYVPSTSIFRDSPSGLDDNLVQIVGSNPLRIIARGVFGVRPTDPIIDTADALLIISSEENQRLLREGKVAIVLNSSVLTTPIKQF